MTVLPYGSAMSARSAETETEKTSIVYSVDRWERDRSPGRSRRVGPLAGAIGVEAGWLDAWRTQLRADVQLLDAGDSETVLVDDDGCWIDDTLLCGRDAWLAILRDGRLGELDGPFAVAWRSSTGDLTLARDGIGERTLYYAEVGGGLLFASSIRDLLASGRIDRALCLSAVANYLSCAYLPGRQTMVRGVFELLPGETLRWRQGRITRHRYWHLPPEVDEGLGPRQLRDELRAVLHRAVARRLPVGEPAGAFLSGGLDSSLVVALASTIVSSGDGPPLRTYSLSFGDGYANELAFSSQVAAHCRTRHRIVELPPETVLHCLDDVIGMLSDPIGDPLTVPNAVLFREAARDVGVVLNGEGGDPCFGGPKNLPMLLAELYDDDADSDEQLALARARSYLRAHLKCYDDLPRMLDREPRDALCATPLEPGWAASFADANRQSYVARLQAMNIVLKGAHHILPKVDALSRPFGVLPRSPLFDRRIVALSQRIPAHWKLHGSIEKYLLKEAVKDLLPPSIIHRPKSGMLVPVEAWFQAPMKKAAEERLRDGLRGLIRDDYLQKLLDFSLGGVRPRHGAKIWLLLTLESWLRTVLGPTSLQALR
jgi:asparagine synthase (glutamine-hydrolysing)